MKRFLVAGVALAVLAAGCGTETKATVATSSPSPSSASPNDPTDTPTDIPTDQATDVPTDEAAPASKTSGLAIGTTLDLSDDSGLKGQVTLQKLKIYRSVRDQYTGTTKPTNGRFLVLTVLYTVSAGDLDYNQFDFGAQAADGTVFDPADGKSTEAESALDLSGGLSSGTLHAGQKRKGFVVVDGPAHGEITFSPASSVAGSWKY